MSSETWLTNLTNDCTGALLVALRLFQLHGQDSVDACDELGIAGKDLWLLYQDCASDIDITYHAIISGDAIDLLLLNPASSMFQGGAHG